MKILKRALIVFDLLLVLCMSAITFAYYTTPNFYFSNELENQRYLSVEKSTVTTSVSYVQEARLKAFGVFDVKEVSVVEESNKVIVCGTPLGIDIYTKGLSVAGTNYIDSDKESPAKTAGIKMGDLILSVNGQSIETIQELRNCIGMQPMEFLILRDKKEMAVRVQPIYSTINQRYEIGLWVRDSNIGMGMLSFYCKNINIGVALGHGVMDADSGQVIDLQEGSVYTSSIYSLNKASAGVVGQLYGKINIYDKLGEIVYNEENGLYCNMVQYGSGTQYEVAGNHEIELGQATLITTLDDNKTASYEVEVISLNSTRDTKNIKIKVTDPVLLQRTGGIVQGMSGSPILQNGKLIGAISHALIEDPTIGYAVYAKTMLETAYQVSQKE